MIVKKSEELIANISRYDKVVVVAVAPSNQDKALELKYFLWRGKYEDSPTRFREKFYNEIKENQTVGLIDPSFHENAKEAYECFGKDLKVILMMRNPVDATYSNFKMRMRRTKHKSYVDYYKDTKVFNVEMFGKYIDHAVIGGKDERYRYTDCVEEYINYFGKENVKLVIFEEIISDTKRIMNEIQEFIGVTPKVYTKLPHSNSGKEVSKNYRCAKINRNLHRLRISLKGKNLPTLCKWERNLEKKIFKKTMMEFHESMLPKHREVLENFYREDIKRLEHILGRSLEGIWY